MVKKTILSTTLAAMLGLSTQTVMAQLLITGQIQAEIHTAKAGTGDWKTGTHDVFGAPVGGPNNLTFTVQEKVGPGMIAFARLSLPFATMHEGALRNRESAVGLKVGHVHLRGGRMPSAYKKSGLYLDPLVSTSMEGRIVGGGMTGGQYRDANGLNTDVTGDFTHSGGVSDLVEFGYDSGARAGDGINIRIQSMMDPYKNSDRAWIGSARYKNKKWSVVLSGIKADYVPDPNKTSNIKLGGNYRIGGLNLSAQYEYADFGTYDQSADAQYLYTAAAYRKGNITYAGWIAKFLSKVDNEDAFSYAVGLKYHFSKKTFAYIGYRNTNSDNDVRDQQIIASGISKKF